MCKSIEMMGASFLHWWLAEAPGSTGMKYSLSTLEPRSAPKEPRSAPAEESDSRCWQHLAVLLDFPSASLRAQVLKQKIM